jgi:hypothetical protein
MAFEEFRDLVQLQVQFLVDGGHSALYLTDIDKDKLYDIYLSSFPSGTNELYLERTSHDCSACKQFIRTFGGVVAIVDNILVSVWDMEGLDSTYNPVAQALSTYVKSAPISGQFIHSETMIGVASNVAQLTTGAVQIWYHLHAALPPQLVVKHGESVGATTGEMRDRKTVFMRAVTELTADAVETVLDLISQNSLYRGEEFKPILSTYLKAHKAFSHLSDEQRDLFCWDMAAKLPTAVLKIRNSAIGTLLIDLSEGVDLDEAVRKFEAVIAPSNYKRPKAIFSQKMLEDAQKTVTELGLIDSLPRRFATVEDIKLQNILFANTDIMRKVADTGIFAEMSNAIPANTRQFKGVEEVPIEKFIADILPRLTSIEILLENRHSSNLVSVIAPADSAAPSMFKWGNGFSWAYAGNITDSMKQRVKDAGGAIDGVLRFSIQWNEDRDNRNDFDAHCIEPNRNHIYYPSKGSRHSSSGMLDVDIIHPDVSQIAVENITWSQRELMPEGEYRLRVHNFSNRGGTSGFRAEIEFDGEIYSFDYPKAMQEKETIDVATVLFSRANGFSMKRSLDSSVSSKVLWGKPTNQFHPVSAMMLSPNYWDEQQGNGNKHFLFILDGCINDEEPNGFFNEFLRNDLMPHKRVFEALGSKMKVSGEDPKQLSGVGFSSTKRNNVICKVTGHIQRTIKITV